MRELVYKTLGSNVPSPTEYFLFVTRFPACSVHYFCVKTMYQGVIIVNYRISIRDSFLRILNEKL